MRDTTLREAIRDIDFDAVRADKLAKHGEGNPQGRWDILYGNRKGSGEKVAVGDE